MSLAAFVVPHRAEENYRTDLLRRTLSTIEQQSDSKWICIIADDASPVYKSEDEILSLLAPTRRNVYVTRSILKSGPGACRNRGIRMASALGANIILHQDDDDLAHPNRVEITRETFSHVHGSPFLYSPFVQIGDNDVELAASERRVDMVEVAEQLERLAPTGNNVFEEMACGTGFIAALSSVALTTADALQHPFPSFGRASDDSHTWMRLAASGANFVYESRLRFKYRVPSGTPIINGDFVRPKSFLEEKVYNDVDGYECGVHLLLKRKTLSARDVAKMTFRFLDRLSQTIERQHYLELAERIRQEKFQYSVLRRLTGETW